MLIRNDTGIVAANVHDHNIWGVFLRLANGFYTLWNSPTHCVGRFSVVDGVAFLEH